MITQNRFTNRPDWGQTGPATSPDTTDWAEIRRFSYRIAVRMLPSLEAAEEVTQEAMIRIWRHRSALRSPEKEPGWIARVVRNEAARYLGRWKLEEVLEDEDGRAIDDDPIAAVPARADLQTAMKRLDPRDRALLLLRYSVDLTQPAIADLLGVPEGTVKVQLHRARSRLKSVLDSG